MKINRPSPGDLSIDGIGERGEILLPEPPDDPPPAAIEPPLPGPLGVPFFSSALVQGLAPATSGVQALGAGKKSEAGASYTVEMSGDTVTVDGTDPDPQTVKVPLLITPLFFEVLSHLPGGENRFDMTNHIGAGGRIVLGMSKRFAATLGGTIGFENTGTRAFESRGWSQGNFHGALGVLYRADLGGGYKLLAGPALTRIMYMSLDQPAGVENEKYRALKEHVQAQRPSIRGDYYNAPYAYFDLQRYKDDERRFQLELNLLIPGRFPEPIVAQQEGSLVKTVRVKFVLDKVVGKLSAKADIKLPTIEGRYDAFRLRETTGRIELQYPLVAFDEGGGSIDVVGGYHRDWHAMNFPELLPKDASGSWGAAYLGLRINVNGKKSIEVPKR